MGEDRRFTVDDTTVEFKTTRKLKKYKSFNLDNNEDRKNLLETLTDNNSYIKVSDPENIPVILSIPTKIVNIFRDNKENAINFIEDFRNIYRNKARNEGMTESTIYQNELRIKKIENTLNNPESAEFLENNAYINHELEKINENMDNEILAQQAKDIGAMSMRLAKNNGGIKVAKIKKAVKDTDQNFNLEQKQQGIE